MKKHKFYIIVFLFVIVSLVLVGCTEPQKAVIFRLDENDVELGVGEAYTPLIVVENIKNMN